ncbi:MAG: hypothetical protein HQM00_02525 [Magnetococcales bacterium]|nr:hypothetical protein [Magnetococcales bacterium]
MPSHTCTQCGASLPPSQTAHLTEGESITCRECGEPTLADFSPHNPSHSKAIEIYLDHVFENDSERYLGFDLARIRRFEKHLREQKLTPRSMGPSVVRRFLERIRLTEGINSARGHESTLMEFFKALTLKGWMHVNPLSEERRQTQVDTRGFSEELVTFVTYQEGTGFTENLLFDVPRIQVWEAFLERRKKNIRTAEEKDLAEFMAMAHQRYSPKQACGLALTIQELYQVMQQSDLMREIPQCEDFFRCRDLLEQALLPETGAQEHREFPPMRAPVRGQRKRTLFWIAAAGILSAVAALLVWQLLPRDSGREEVMHQVRQKAKEIKGSMTDTLPLAPDGSRSGIQPSNPTTRPESPAPRTAAQPPARNDPPKGTTPKPDATKNAPPKEAPKPDATKGAPPKIETPQAPKAEAPKAEAPKPDATKNAPPKEAPKPEAPKPEAPKKADAPPTATPAEPQRLIGCVEGDCKNGLGTFIHDDGARYIGGWSKGKKHGKGEFRFSSGGGYKGVWENGHMTHIE